MCMAGAIDYAPSRRIGQELGVVPHQQAGAVRRRQQDVDESTHRQPDAVDDLAGQGDDAAAPLLGKIERGQQESVRRGKPARLRVASPDQARGAAPL